MEEPTCDMALSNTSWRPSRFEYEHERVATLMAEGSLKMHEDLQTGS